MRADYNAAYLVMPGTKSCIAGYFNLAADPNPLDYNKAPHNALILVDFCALKNIVCSAAGQSVVGSFTTCRMQS
eukprot:1638614-Ditylum_brightwellii.AAC.1